MYVYVYVYIYMCVYNKVDDKEPFIYNLKFHVKKSSAK